MTEPPNMDEPVTRREFYEAFGSLLARMDRQSEVITAQAATITASVTASLGAEMARQIQASEERMRDYMRALVEPHDGVPERVTKLEDELLPRVERLEKRVFAPKRRATSRTRTRSRRR